MHTKRQPAAFRRFREAPFFVAKRRSSLLGVLKICAHALNFFFDSRVDIDHVSEQLPSSFYEKAGGIRFDLMT